MLRKSRARPKQARQGQGRSKMLPRVPGQKARGDGGKWALRSAMTISLEQTFEADRQQGIIRAAGGKSQTTKS